MKNLLLASLMITMTACANNGPSFVNMSEVELAAYNRELPAEQRVYCVVEATTSTFIRKRVCRTYEDWLAHNERELMRLDVLNSRPSTGLQRTVRDGF